MRGSPSIHAFVKEALEIFIPAAIPRTILADQIRRKNLRDAQKAGIALEAYKSAIPHEFRPQAPVPWAGLSPHGH